MSQIIKRITTFSILILIFTPVVCAEGHYIDDVPLLDQEDKPWCGPVSAVMILQYWKFEVSVSEAGMAVDPEEDGVYSYELKNYFETFEVRTYEFDSMNELKRYI